MSKYTSDMDQRVIELMSVGMSLAATAATLNINRDTLQDWTNKESPRFQPSLSVALKKGKELSLLWWEEQGRVNMQNKDFSYTGWYMNMKNRFGWRDKVENTVDVTSKGESVAIDPALAAEWTQFLRNRSKDIR